MALDMKEVLDLTDALNKRRDKDREGVDLMNEISAALAEHVEVLKKISDAGSNPLAAGDIASAIADALKSALADMPAPTVQFTAPEQGPVQLMPSKRKGCDIEFKSAPNGAIQSAKLTFF